jgi:hypothetical protein
MTFLSTLIVENTIPDKVENKQNSMNFNHDGIGTSAIRKSKAICPIRSRTKEGGFLL